MIAANAIGFRHPGQPAWLFRDLGFRLERGRTLALLGRNGRGKTTLLKCLAGLLTPVEGGVTRDGAVGYVAQAFASPFPYTVFEIVLMGRARHVGLFSTPTAADRARARAAIAEIGLAEFAGRRIDTLSGGERQLALIARALAAQAEILLLDEPASALDFRNQAKLLALLRTLSRERGLTILMTTHDPTHALEIADRAVLLHGDGRAEEGPVALMCAQDKLTALYGLEMRRLEFDAGGRKAAGILPLYGADYPRL